MKRKYRPTVSGGNQLGRHRIATLWANFASQNRRQWLVWNFRLCSCPPATPGAGSFDRVALVAVVEGDLTLLHELAEVFLADTPALITGLREAVVSRDSPRIAALAHRLKGSAANFQARPATATAQKLEEMGNSGGMEGVDAALADFERAVDELMDGLQAL
jgi:histidine phosphotransfer protein HptB